MRDPNRITPTLQYVEAIWRQNPDWRLGQLIYNLARDYGYFDSYYIEDDKLVEVIKCEMENPK
jgi:uncharacterized protein YihD (DUF1040 family)